MNCQLCQNPAKYGAYCGTHIRKYQLEECQKRLRLNNSFGHELCRNIGERLYRQKNPLQPNWIPTIKSPGSEAKTLTEFTTIMLQYLDILLSLMERQSAVDQRDRAKELAKCITPNIEEVVLMDGHGSLTLLFFLAVLELHGGDRLNRLKITIVDIDLTVVNYHEKFFAFKNISSSYKDITAEELSPNKLIYMNFCGITKSLVDVKSFLQKIGSKVQPLLVSFSYQRRASVNDGTKKNVAARLKRAVPNGKKFTVVTEREDFKTFRLDTSTEVTRSRHFED
eukprot:TRINITY_DN14616_c0_g1_i1.p1 TRINITY_DN14616_c0_g1~~TRINITY_DN14616_c0_g1_i1.p1  ORF type:complete len:281 (-),score=27.28 TRINITY_DN14616_c0_g1_i1:103-945(-)